MKYINLENFGTVTLFLCGIEVGSGIMNHNLGLIFIGAFFGLLLIGARSFDVS